MRLVISFFAATLLVACTTTGPITATTVRDAEFRIVKVLAPAELTDFERQWENKQEVQVSLNNVGGQHFKLDVERRGSGGRWLYQTTGYAQLLSVHAKPVYRLRDPEVFNRLIGAVQ